MAESILIAGQRYYQQVPLSDAHHRAHVPHDADSSLTILAAMKEPAQAIADEVIELAQAIRAVNPEAVPVAFWDFDGTLFKGDCSEGYAGEDGGYTGLTEMAINQGLSQRYPDGMDRFHADFATVAARHGSSVAHGFITQVFEGAREDELMALARQSFGGMLRPWFLTGALQILRALEAAGIRCWIISATADFFVKGAAAQIPLPEERIHGVRLECTADGVFSGALVAPTTSGDGKAARLRELLDEMKAREPGRTFHPVAAFGDSMATDGAMFEAVASVPLPAGTPVCVAVNGNGRAWSLDLRHITFQATGH